MPEIEAEDLYDAAADSGSTRAEGDVLAERAKQRVRWGDDHDDEEHQGGELAVAASYLADPFDGGGCLDEDDPEAGWAVRLKARHDRRQQLVIAAALLLAEIERLNRAEASRG